MRLEVETNELFSAYENITKKNDYYKLLAEYKVLSELLTIANKELILIEDKYNNNLEFLKFKGLARKMYDFYHYGDITMNSSLRHEIYQYLDNNDEFKYYSNVLNLNLAGFEYRAILQMYLNVDAKIYKNNNFENISDYYFQQRRDMFSTKYNSFSKYITNDEKLLKNNQKIIKKVEKTNFL